ncbi:MAG TPA: aminotransferase class I/II-fold pyridoxal phosphate-dependent enzyme [Kineosporiaceae bacterium]|nr:aminotransferase class I/II-fold pyridoxal phosphate-dependent enzyme [Kineosporiaceae bacterium]
MTGFVYLSSPDVGEIEREALLAAFDSNWVAPAGPDLDAFEQVVAAEVGVAHAVALSSGTAALHLSLQLAGVRPGDEVLVPSFTFAATANAVAYLGAEPVFVDSTPDTWAIDPELVAEELARADRAGRPIAAVVPVDVYGQCAEYDELEASCGQYGVPLVEDAAEALGSSYRGRPAGSFGIAAALSFNGNKIITTGGGGMLITDDAELAGRARHLATQAREPVPHYEHREIGYNYRLSNLLAAVGLGQMRTLRQRVERRRHNYRFYRQSLAGDGLSLMPLAEHGRSNCWLTCLLVDVEEFGATPEQICDHLRSAGIEARPTWKPMHLQPVHQGRRTVGGAVCEDLFRRGVCLPSGSNLRRPELDRVVDAVRSVPRRLTSVSA